MTKNNMATEERARGGNGDVDPRDLFRALLAAREAERLSVARILNEGIGQILAAVKYVIEAEPPPGEASRREETVGLIRDAMEQVRDLSASLRPDVLDDLGLMAGLGALARSFARESGGMDLTVRMELPEEEVPNRLKVPLYRIAEEALRNAASHSRARRVALTLAGGDEWLRLTVEDDGRGFLGVGPGAGLGLAVMDELAGGCGGRVEVRSFPRGGSTVTAWFPLRVDGAPLAGGGGPAAGEGGVISG